MARVTTLPEFLLAQIEADEAAASAALDCEEPTGSASWYVDGPAVNSGKFWVYATGEKFSHEPIAQHIARHDPARVLRECKAKRAIVEMHSAHLSGSRNTLRALASVYADHPDFDEGWLE